MAHQQSQAHASAEQVACCAGHCPYRHLQSPDACRISCVGLVAGAVAGAVDSGKSTLVAVLTHGCNGRPLLDNGRGAARMAVFRHKHEIESGRTSSISQHLLGYDRHSCVINYGGVAAPGRQWTTEQEQRGAGVAEEGKSEEETRTDYRRIAERRVRLGLLLAEVGEKAGLKVEDNEVTQALVERARAYPGQEKEVWEFYQKNPDAMAQIRAPIFEDKVIDKILGEAKVTERKVEKDELFKMEDEPAAA